MWPSGKVKVCSAGDTCFADGAVDAGTALVAVAAGAAVEAVRRVSIAVRSAVPLTARFEAAAGVPGCAPHPARTRLTEKPALVTAVKNVARREFIV
jgi:hypothetical protein